ncbi:MAG: phenylalanine--tRNA ligase subunit beta [Marinilabiliales bacterium]|nr:MAG: phenylalanine--tRNA ligase subunit beta [Marinilabiliales bacterium]
MKLSYNWLKQYVNTDLSPEELSPILTDIGLEVEGLEKFQSVKGGLEGVVIGEVKTCKRHENADKLSVTTVEIGTGELLPIVCGAPNVAAGQKVAVATVGTKLYDGDESFTIKKAKIRGEHSQGMICAEDELGLGTSHEGIMVLPEELKTGIPASDYFNVEEDYVFEIGLTPNRGDAASHIGSARDLVAGLNRISGSKNHKLNLPSVDDFKVDNTNLDIDVIVESPEACRRYSGISISDITIAESPEWLKNKLNAIGLRPINNIVDITNYVLHETGQPLHAFDADKIRGNKVIVKKLSPDTKFMALDEVERKIDGNDLMICNTEEGMCIAGVFGGIDSGVSNSTKNIFLESAYFYATHIRKTSKRHALQTDASFRFERGADPNITVYALKRAAMLMKEIAGGKISSEIKDVYPDKINNWNIDISYANVDRLIGKKIDRSIIKDILTDLEVKTIEEHETGLKVEVPTFKVEVTREVDIIEEILRIYGYNNIELDNKIHSSISLRQKPDLEKIQNMISDYLSAQGFAEIMNNSLTKAEYSEKIEVFNPDENVNILNPLSKDLNVMRQSLIFGGLESIAYNQNRRISNQKIYEFGKIYQKTSEKSNNIIKDYFEERHLLILASGNINEENWDAKPVKADFYFVKSMVEAIINRLGIDRKQIKISENGNSIFSYSLDYVLNNNIIASIGNVQNKVLKVFDIKKDVYGAIVNWTNVCKFLPTKNTSYEPVQKFPSVRRDLALVLDKNISFEKLKEVSYKAERKLLVEVGLFDIYEGDKIPEGKKSYALSFILQDKNKTLNDKTIDKTMKRIQQLLENECGAVLR